MKRYFIKATIKQSETRQVSVFYYVGIIRVRFWQRITIQSIWDVIIYDCQTNRVFGEKYEFENMENKDIEIISITKL